MITICYYLFLVINVIYAIHFGIPTLIGLCKKDKKTRFHSRQAHFGILIPARNEEIVIGNLLESLQKQNYAKDYYDIYVLINHTKDHTKQVTLQHGCKPILCPDTVRGKADVLQYAFQTLQAEPIDAYIIFDADNVVDSNFLKAMNQAYQQGSQVAQCHRDSKNMSDNWLSGGYSIFYFIQNLFYSTKERNHISSMINGTGFLIQKQIIDLYDFPMKTLTEDMEFSAFCALHNIKIHYVKDAITYDEQPIQFKTSWKQRKRWTAGAYQCFHQYSKLLLTAKQNKLFNLEVFYIFFSPLLQVLTCVTFAMNLIYVLFRDGISSFVVGGIILGILGYFGLVLFALFTVWYNGKKFKQIYKGVLCFPFFLSTWIPIHFLVLFKRIDTWEPIEHTVMIKVDEIGVKTSK